MMSSQVDVIVIGAGFGGLYAVHKLRDEMGLSVKAFDASTGPGGVWSWNRYPGARCDIESVHYSYSFSDEIQRGWEWSERFAAQPEILAYLEYVADTIDVRKEYSFESRVVSTVWSDEHSHWTVKTDKGEKCTARFVIAATGNLSVPKKLEFTDADAFEGELYPTSNWPRNEVDFKGKRVAVIGTGASGVQVIQTIADKVEHLTVFQRTPNFCTPLQNTVIDPDQRRWMAQNFEQVRAGTRESLGGVPYGDPHPSSHAVTQDQRHARYAEMIERGGLRLNGVAYADFIVDEAANQMVSDYVRDHIRSRVKDPAVAEKLVPNDHPYGTKRPPLEIGYYEVFNRDNVDLVDLRTNPIERFTQMGIQTAEGQYEFDMIILATGFDALSGALLRLGIKGREGLSLNDAWKDGPRTFLGIAVHGFPNLFTITGPTSAVVLYNNPLANQDHVDLAAAAIKYCREHGANTIEATTEGQDRWSKFAYDLLHMTLFPRANSWYMGANVPGKPISAEIFAGPAPLYRAFTDAVQEQDFAGFELDNQPSAALPTLFRVDPALASVVGTITGRGMLKPLERYDIDEMRRTLDTFSANLPAGPNVAVVDAEYSGGRGQKMPARIYNGKGEGTRSVIVFFHGGGFVAGSIDAIDRRCRLLADELDAVVIAPSYSLAPEAPFPAAVDDAFAALKWVAASVAEHGGDNARLFVAGESAGGTLAAVLAQLARDEGGPVLAGQILITPAIDASAKTGSRIEHAKAPILSTAAMDRFWTLYLGDDGDATSALASPGRASSLAELAPALVVTAELDPLRDEAEDYARRLTAAGVPTTARRFDGLTHGSFDMDVVVPQARGLIEEIRTFVRRPNMADAIGGAFSA